jgi:hypothetical protein
LGRNAFRALVAPPDLGPPLPLPRSVFLAYRDEREEEGVFAPPIVVPLDDLPPTPPTPTVTVAEGKSRSRSRSPTACAGGAAAHAVVADSGRHAVRAWRSEAGRRRPRRAVHLAQPRPRHRRQRRQNSRAIRCASGKCTNRVRTRGPRSAPATGTPNAGARRCPPTSRSASLVPAPVTLLLAKLIPHIRRRCGFMQTSGAAGFTPPK